MSRLHPLCLTLVSLLFMAGSVCAQEGLSGADWRADWEVADGYGLERVASGFEMPVRVAFVPEPGEAPDDPLYFVLELRGRLVAVTRSGELRTYAEGLGDYAPGVELPAHEGEAGACGLCLEPERGYVFVSYVRTSEDGRLKNELVRLRSTPGTFSEPLTDRTLLDGAFANSYTAVAHQIGPLVVHDGHLLVAVGDGEQPTLARLDGFTNGKLLRMTLDGEPARDNPHFVDDGKVRVVDYVWARGLRNPFGLGIVDGAVFVADNGPAVDRFVDVDAGDDLLYDGSDWSIGARSLMVWAPAVSPVGFEVAPEGSALVAPEHSGHVFVALSGGPRDPSGPGRNGQRSVVHFGLDADADRLTTAPEPVLRYRGEGRQLPVDAQFGPDGLYVVSIWPDADGVTGILRLRHDPASDHPYRLSDVSKYYGDPELLMLHKGCLSCHSLEAGVDRVGPSLDPGSLRESVLARLTSDAYAARVAELRSEGDERVVDFARRRAEVEAAEGDARLRTWIYHHVQEPQFDNPLSQMPQLGLTDEEAGILADHLAAGAPVTSDAARRHVAVWVKEWLGDLRVRHLGYALGVGFVLGVVALALLGRIRRRRRD